MPFISGKHALLELLKQEGVEVMFGNPGTTELPLMDAFATEKDIHYILGLQEAALMGIADGYAQASGRLTVINVHAAPGLGNALGMLYDAKTAGAPLLVTAGQQDKSFAFSEPRLWADLPAIARPFVKWSAEVQSLADLPQAIHRAAKTALAPPMGPVFLSLPADVLKEEGELELGAPTRVAAGLRGDRGAIEKAAALLAKAQRPLVIAGDAVAQSDAHAELIALAELLGAPVYAEGIPSRASFPSSHPLFAGTMVPLHTAARAILERHDLLLSIGADLFTLSLPADREPMPPGLPIVHLDTDAWELGKNYPTTVAILGDPKTTLPELTAAAGKGMNPAGRARAEAYGQATKTEIAAALAKLKSRAAALGGERPIHPLALVHALGELLPANAVIVDETHSSGVGLRQLIKSDDPQSFFGLRGGGIGWGIPAAVGIKLALPQRPVVALVGDGSAMYTLQALWTAARERAAAAFVILNNSSYHILKQRAQAMEGHAAQTGTYVGMDLNDPPLDFVRLANGLGVDAERVTTIEAVRDALRQWLPGNAPLLLDVAIGRP